MVLFYLRSTNLRATWEQNGLSSFKVLLLYSNQKQCIFGLWSSSLSYFRIFTTVRNHNSNFHLHGNPISTVNLEEVKVARTIFVIVVLFSLCWIPVLTIDLVDTAFQRWTFAPEAYVAYTFLATISSALNPLIYGVFNKSFRKNYLKVLCCRYCRSQAVVEPLAVRGRANVDAMGPLPKKIQMEAD